MIATRPSFVSATTASCAALLNITATRSATAGRSSCANGAATSAVTPTECPSPPPTATPPDRATHIGRISYGLYLWHVPMYNLTAYHLGLPGVLKPVVGVMLAFGAAELSMKFVERPFLRLKLRMGETRTGQEATRALAAA